PADRVTVRLLHLPPMPERQLRRAVALELGSTVLLPFDDPVFDAVRVPPLGESEEGVGAVLVVAASRTYVERGLALVRAAGLVPAAVDIAPLARLRVAGAMAWRTPGVHVLVHMDPADTTIGIVANGALYFLRTIEHAWNGESPPDWPARMADIVYEVERVTQFFQFNLAGRETPVDGVWLSGEALQEAEAVRRFESLAGLPVTALPIEVTAGRPVLHLPAERYATAAGLALKGGSR
ncbi:hypothetical protein, partial [Alicyclobacillus sp.]|uniref:type IV pilus biogenesis protein PilM n=1 Tax=Alicyclobacillus sp. TaxID=61169 RepID=UPI0025BE565A